MTLPALSNAHPFGIGSNAVVTKDVPNGGIMVGVPAKNISSGSKKTDATFAPYAVTKK